MAARSLTVRRLLRESDIGAGIHLSEVVCNTPTLATPEVEDPGAAKADDTANHEKFAGKDKDVAKLGKHIVILKTEFSTAGLDLASSEFDNPALEVIPLVVNELVYDTFSEVMVIDSVAEQYFLATDCSTDRDGRRALIDSVKGCVPAGLRVSHQEAYAAFRYPARVDPRPVLAKEHRLVRENRAADWRPTEATRRQQLFDRLDPDFYRASEVVGTATAAAIPTGDDSEAKQLLKIVVDKLRVLEHFIKNQKGGTSALKAATATRGGLNGYHPGLERGGSKQAAFDPDARRAVPRCYRCAKADKGSCTTRTTNDSSAASSEKLTAEMGAPSATEGTVRVTACRTGTRSTPPGNSSVGTLTCVRDVTSPHVPAIRSCTTVSWHHLLLRPRRDARKRE
ncbi:hypothetical protein CYMTET_16851 [Cymbomonas tetramitiformis]|uniref:Uncharacterized protein n=1 Tax=Cymbomonas tetramitiformis TaxID=36881 RepID=A0AAE0L7X0_9CHLO|nr:hypothetical protein CYMTET_16851 [Cymbomonas tetramitiformis]